MTVPSIHSPSPRAIAISAIAQWIKKELYVEETLSALFETIPQENFTERDRRFSYEIAIGTVRRWLTITEYLTSYLQVKLPRDPMKKACLAAAIYQRLFHEIGDTPHALVYEYVQIAKKLFGTVDPFYKFLNAVLRKSLTISLDIPSITQEQMNEDQLSKCFSIGKELIHKLFKSYPPSTCLNILQAYNKPIPLFQRGPFMPEKMRFQIRECSEGTCIEATSSTTDHPGEGPEHTLWYIQNPTQPRLMESMIALFLSEKQNQKTQDQSLYSVLDLCAAPGGKSIMCWQALPNIKLTLNDASKARLHRLQENMQRFGVKGNITNVDGTTFPIPGQKDDLYDIALVDAPCSNTGVLYKCPEARYRLSKKTIEQHAALQKKLVARASQLIRPGGYIWYMTCSILPEENENICRWAQETLRLETRHRMLILPDGKKYEGGFCAILQRGLSSGI